MIFPFNTKQFIENQLLKTMFATNGIMLYSLENLNQLMNFQKQCFLGKQKHFKIF